MLVNIHTDPDETEEELDALAEVYRAVRQSSGGEDDIIILGDLNVDDRHLGRLGQIDGVRPIVRGVFTNTRQTALYDNFVVHQPSTAEFTGRWGVFDVRQLFNPPLTPSRRSRSPITCRSGPSSPRTKAPRRAASPARPRTTTATVPAGALAQLAVTLGGQI